MIGSEIALHGLAGTPERRDRVCVPPLLALSGGKVELFTDTRCIRAVTISTVLDFSEYSSTLPPLSASRAARRRDRDAPACLRDRAARFRSRHPRMARALEKLASALSFAGSDSEAAMIGKQAQALRDGLR